MQKVKRMDILQSINHGEPVQVILKNIEHNLEIDHQIDVVNTEFDKLREFNRQLRPLYIERSEIDEKLMIENMDIAMQVALEYPPRKGTDAERQMLTKKLQMGSESFTNLSKRKEELTYMIEEIRYEMTLTEREASSARRLVELHANYVKLLSK